MVALSTTTVPGLFTFYKSVQTPKPFHQVEVLPFEASWNEVVQSASWLPDYLKAKKNSGNDKSSSSTSAGQEKRLSDIDEEYDIRAVIRPPHNYYYQNNFESYWWILFLRFLCPAYSFWTAFLSFLTLKTQLKEHKEPLKRTSFWISFIEIPTMILTGIALAFGTYGPLYFPYKYHLTMSFLFLGFSSLSTCLLLLMMTEKCRLQNGLPERNVYKHYRYTIVACAIFLVGLEFTLTGLSLFAKDYKYTMIVFSSMVMFNILVHVVFGVIFFLRARELSIPLLNYINHSSADTSEAMKRIRFIVQWMTLKGACLFAVALSMTILTSVVFGWLPAQLYSIAVITFSMSRITLTRAQVVYKHV